MNYQALMNTAGLVIAVVGALSAVGIAARWAARWLRSAGISAGLAEKVEVQTALARIEAVLTEIKTETSHRLDVLDESVRGVDRRLVDVEYQVKPNGGGSMRDKVVKVMTQMELHLEQHSHG